ncbi:MAG TPA: hypothetical protein DC013_09975 [Ruminococcaceae bacterium]|jgi:hypothetical protein|nr:hypothetical protein [Oscillospiraceae bacterium]
MTKEETTMKKIGSKWKWMPVLLAVVALLSSVPATALTETASASHTLPRATIPEHTSYVSDIYAGVVHLKADDEAVAVASVDGQNRVVVTAVGKGSTTVSYWYQNSAGAGWVSASLPVTVSGESQSGASVSAASIGITFTQGTAVHMTPGASSTVSGIKKSGSPIRADQLLWVSSSDSVVKVNSRTGEMTGVGKGTATVFAVDPTDQLCTGVTVTVA